jgi:hypothetical protein
MFLIMMSKVCALHAIHTYQWTSETFCKAPSALQHLQPCWILDLVERREKTCLHLLNLSRPTFSSKASATDSKILHVYQDGWFGKSLNPFLTCDVLQACEIELIPASKKEMQYFNLSTTGENVDSATQTRDHNSFMRQANELLIHHKKFETGTTAPQQCFKTTRIDSLVT